MNRNDKRMLIAICLMTAAGAFVWLVTWMIGQRAFIIPADGGGWFFHYQGLVAGMLAVAGAAATVWTLIRDQRSQAKRFDRQMHVLTRSDQLLVSRETTRILTCLYETWLRVHSVRVHYGNPEGAADCEKWFNERANWFVESIRPVSTSSTYAPIEHLCDERWTLLFAGAMHHCVGSLAIDFQQELQIVDEGYETHQQAMENLVPSLRSLEETINSAAEYFQSLRCEYGLPRAVSPSI